MKFKPLIRLIREAPGLKLTTAAWLLLAAVESAAIPFQAYVLRSLIDGVLTGNAQFYYGQAAPDCRDNSGGGPDCLDAQLGRHGP